MKIAWSSHSSCPVDWPKLSHLLLLLWCMAITGYCTSYYNTNSQQQPAVSYRQISKSLLVVSQPRTVKTTTNGIYVWQFKYANTVPTVLITSNSFNMWLHHCHCDKRIVTSCMMWNLLQSIRSVQLLSSILSANYFAIIYMQPIIHKLH